MTRLSTRKTPNGKTPNGKTLNRRFGHLALAFALSAGTVGGMVSFAALTEPAFARGNGNGGGGPAGGGGDGNVMNPAAANIAGVPNRGRGRPQAFPRFRTNPCGQANDGVMTDKCKYTEPRAVRVVSIHGFANCAVVQQAPTGEFYCFRPM